MHDPGTVVICQQHRVLDDLNQGHLGQNCKHLIFCGLFRAGRMDPAVQILQCKPGIGEGDPGAEHAAGAWPSSLPRGFEPELRCSHHRDIINGLQQPSPTRCAVSGECCIGQALAQKEREDQGQ